MGGGATDVWPATTLPSCVPPLPAGFDPVFATGGPPPTAGSAFSNHDRYLVDWNGSGAPLIQDMGLVPASVLFGALSWNVFQPANPEQIPSPDDLGYHNRDIH